MNEKINDVMGDVLFWGIITVFTATAAIMLALVAIFLICA